MITVIVFDCDNAYHDTTDDMEGSEGRKSDADHLFIGYFTADYVITRILSAS